MFKYNGIKEAFFMDRLNAVEFKARIHDWNCRNNGCFVMAFVAEGDAKSVPDLQSMCHAQGVDLFGAVFPALLTDAEVVENGLFIARLDGIPRPRLFENAGQPDRVGAIADEISVWAETHLGEDEGALFTLFDVAVPNISSHLTAWHSRLGDWVRYCGINAGSETFQPSRCLFDADHIVESGLLALLLPGHPGAAVMHGFKQPEEFKTVTAAADNRIVQVDWQPAVQVYQEMIRRGCGIDVTSENFYHYALYYPFGLIRADGEILVRIPVMLAGNDGVACAGEIPPNSILTLLDASQAANVAADMAVELRRRGRGLTDETLLAFYCGGRLHQQGSNARRELQDLLDLSGAKHLFGAISLGEIGTAAGGYPLFHNAALVAMP